MISKYSYQLERSLGSGVEVALVEVVGVEIEVTADGVGVGDLAVENWDWIDADDSSLGVGEKDDSTRSAFATNLEIFSCVSGTLHL